MSDGDQEADRLPKHILSDGERVWWGFDNENAPEEAGKYVLINDEPKCGNCKFFRGNGYRGRGYCFRYPVRSEQLPNSWCGEFAALGVPA